MKSKIFDSIEPSEKVKEEVDKVFNGIKKIEQLHLNAIISCWDDGKSASE